MDDLSLAHSRYNCTYHIVFIPRYCKKAMFGTLRRGVGEILGKVCKMEKSGDHKGSDNARSCSHVCIDSAEKECVKSDRKDQRKKVR